MYQGKFSNNSGARSHSKEFEQKQSRLNSLQNDRIQENILSEEFKPVRRTEEEKPRQQTEEEARKAFASRRFDAPRNAQQDSAPQLNLKFNENPDFEPVDFSDYEEDPYENPNLYYGEKPRKHRAGPVIGGILFYVLLVMGIFVFVTGMNKNLSQLNSDLTVYEKQQPDFLSGEIFSSLFAAPNWGVIYDNAEIDMPVYEGKEAFVSYMERKMGSNRLTYRPLPAVEEDRIDYAILKGNEKIGTFTLQNQNPEAYDWQLSNVRILVEPESSYTVQCKENHQILVNGLPAEDLPVLQRTGIKLSENLGEAATDVEIPATCLYELDGLLVMPEITVLDDQGEAVEVNFDEATGIFSEVTAEEEIPKEARNLAVNAVSTYCRYMIKQANSSHLSKYFKTGTPTFKAITGSDLNWIQKQSSFSTADQKVSDYVRLSDTSYIIHVSLTWVLTRQDFSEKESHVDVNLLFEQERSGKWTCVRMSGLPFLEPFNTVRVRFLRHENVLDTVMFHSGDETITYPQVEVPDGKILAGWVAVWQDENGEDYYQRVLKADDSRTVPVPDGVFDGPVDLRPVFAKK